MNVTQNVPKPRGIDNRKKIIKILNYSISHLNGLEEEINQLLADGWEIDKKYLVHDNVAEKTTGFIVWMSKKE